ncbi:resolvase [Corallincola holothuriorum]|uniref:Resolvase n=1 Tax=Corallincola holothuriorum TaxID=2282215 RepID=A0A368N012_9GAMM|nr:recombinase family protein [Corallincola holothuriorum]RCU43818.1 resolvase [Corallincola holothuriorum]
MTTIAYIRVSTTDQNTDRQLDGETYDKAFTDKCSGGSKERPALVELLDYVRDGDLVIVHSIDRLARNIDDLRSLVLELNNKGVTVRFCKESLTFSANDTSPMSELMLNMLGAVAQFERSMIKERQAEGIAKAKDKGVYKGRTSDMRRNAEIHKLKGEGLTNTAIAKQVGCSPKTVQRVLKQVA